MICQWGRLIWWMGQNAAIAQGILTIATIWFAIYMAKRQRTHERARDEAERVNQRALANENESSNLKHTRIALREELTMIGSACLQATNLWILSKEAISIRSLIFPVLTVFEANTGRLGQLNRNEIIGLVGVSASLADLRVIAHDIEGRRLAMAGRVPGQLQLTPQDIEPITGLLRSACFRAADFLEANPERPDPPLTDSYLSLIEGLKTAAQRTLQPDAIRH